MNNGFKNLVFICTLSVIFIFSDCNDKGSNSAKSVPASDSVTYNKAITDITLEIESNSGNAELYYSRANLFYNDKFLNRAEDDMNLALRIDSLNPLYHYFMGRISYAMNKTKDAAEHYEKSIQLKPDFLEAKLKLADLYFVVKEHQKSIDLLLPSINLDKSNSNIYHMLAMNYRELGDTSRAIYYFQTAYENNDKDYESVLYLANLYAAKGKEIALEYFNYALKLRPKSTEAFFARAVFFQKLRKYKLAVEDYKKVIDTDPSNYLSYYNVGYINFETNHFDEAIRNWSICIRMNNEYLPAYYMRGLVYEETKKYKDARDNYQFVLNSDPNYELAKAGLKRIAGK